MFVSVSNMCMWFDIFSSLDKVVGFYKFLEFSLNYLNFHWIVPNLVFENLLA